MPCGPVNDMLQALEVLREYGFDENQIKAFEKEGAVFVALRAEKAGRPVVRAAINC